MIPPLFFRDHILVPSLVEINSYSKAAERLLLGTAIVESGLKYTKQINGPALGFFQMEPATHDYIWLKFIGATRREHLLQGLSKLAVKPADSKEMRNNPFYAAAMARINYLRFPEALPDENDIEAIAVYWKKYYNTAAGKGTVERFINEAGIIMTL